MEINKTIVMASKINRTPILTGKTAEEFERRARATEKAHFPQPEAMFPITELREAYYYYDINAKGEKSAANLFLWLNTLEKDIPFNQQRYQP